MEKIAQELIDRGDELATWMKNRPKAFKIASTTSDQSSLQRLAAWAASQSTSRHGAIGEFLAAADYFLIAHAHSLGNTGSLMRYRRRPPRIGSRFLSLQRHRGSVVLAVQMLKNENVQFVL